MSIRSIGGVPPQRGPVGEAAKSASEGRIESLFRDYQSTLKHAKGILLKQIDTYKKIANLMHRASSLPTDQAIVQELNLCRQAYREVVGYSRNANRATTTDHKVAILSNMAAYAKILKLVSDRLQGRFKVKSKQVHERGIRELTEAQQQAQDVAKAQAAMQRVRAKQAAATRMPLANRLVGGA